MSHFIKLINLKKTYVLLILGGNFNFIIIHVMGEIKNFSTDGLTKFISLKSVDGSYHHYKPSLSKSTTWPQPTKSSSYRPDQIDMPGVDKRPPSRDCREIPCKPVVGHSNTDPTTEILCNQRHALIL